MLVIIELKGSDENKRKRMGAAIELGVSLAKDERFDVQVLENLSGEGFKLSGDNTLFHDEGGMDWDGLPWCKHATKAISILEPRLATVDVIIMSKKLPRTAYLFASNIITLDADKDDDWWRLQTANAARLSTLLKDARRFRALVNLGTMRHIGSAGFNGRERIKNDHYYHMSFDVWSTGYEGAYTSDYADNKEMFERYTQALIDNYKNGMDGRTE